MSRLVAAGALGAVLLLAGALAAPSQSHAVIPEGRYVGNTGGTADLPLSFNVTEVTVKKDGKRKSKLKVKNFRMESVTMGCELRDPKHFPWVFPFPPPTEVEHPVPFGGGKVKKKNGKFSTKERSFPNLDSGIVGKARGRLDDGTGTGTFKARFYDYYLDCRSGSYNWEAQWVG